MKLTWQGVIFAVLAVLTCLIWVPVVVGGVAIGVLAKIFWMAAKFGFNLIQEE